MSATPGALPFDVCGPLPSGVTVLEASAGTGKTFTIAALAVRYVAEGTRLEDMLLVTFTRMATGELRQRVRERLVATEDGLARLLAGAGSPEDDVVRLLGQGARVEVERRRRRLSAALSSFDAATIETTHGFCRQILTGLGVSGDIERDLVFVDDVDDLVDEVVDDLYVRRFHDTPPRFGRSEARRIAQVAVANPDAPLRPTNVSCETKAAMRRRLAEAVRAELEIRKRRLGIVTFDDLLTRLQQTLADPVRGAAACAVLRGRYRVALVDEFQDTDPIQWDILRRAFGSGSGSGDPTLVLIGDPKQAIYSFRGADVYAYLEAARTAGTKATLSVNWRSDQGLIDAYDALLRGVRLGHLGIAYHTVRASAANIRPRLEGAPVAEPLRVRVVQRGDGRVALTNHGYVAVPSGREHVAADLAADVVRLLSSQARVIRRDGDGSATGDHPLRPGHLAVLVRTNRQASLVREALEAAAVPAVINGAGSVFGTQPAREWLRLLESLERPSSQLPAHSAALTSFLGWTAEQVATADDDAWEEVHARLHRWAALLRGRGVAALLETISLSQGLPRRVLARASGERELTDLRHVGQLLHAASTSEQLGVTALTAWLRERIAEADSETHHEERSRRLDSDAEAVQVLTIHRSKGLEFPVVYYPYLWDVRRVDDDYPVFHDPDNGDVRTVDVGGGGPDFGRHKKQYEHEQAGEDLRLMYVALTRAQHQAVVWWAGTRDSRHSALGRLLFCTDADGNVAPIGAKVPADLEVADRLTDLAGRVPGRISVEQAGGGDGSRWEDELRPAVDLEVSAFDRSLDRHWRRTSYSAITARAHESRVGSEAEEAVVMDEGGVPPPVPAVPHELGRLSGGEPGEALPALLGGMPGGVEVGTFVHSVLERIDFAAADLGSELAAGVAQEQDRRHLDIGDPAAVVAGLRAALETPLGPLVGDLRLRDLARGDRIDELSFELPLVGGEAPAGALSVQDVGRLLRRHLRAGDPVSGYADRLDDPALDRDLRGYLSGSLDLVLRTTAQGGTQRFAVVDYKTNVLAATPGALTSWHYRPAALADEMQRSHYVLQALLYVAALHRYLRWRLPGYSPEKNLAGILYLFVRGMSGPSTPRVAGHPCGVFSWRPPAPLVEALSDLLDRGGAAA